TDAQGAFAASGWRPATRVRDRLVARGYLGHSGGSGKIRENLTPDENPTQDQEETMRQRLVAFIFITAAAGGAQLAAADVSSSKDLMATIALNGMPCDEVVDVKRN